MVNISSNIVVLFDGECAVCNRAIRFIALRDKKKIFLFAPLQSSKGIELLKKFSISPTELNSLVVIDRNKFFTHSTAILQICKNLYGGWKMLYVSIIFPKLIRDMLYKFIADRRYKFFKNQTSCKSVLPAVQERMLR